MMSGIMTEAYFISQRPRGTHTAAMRGSKAPCSCPAAKDTLSRYINRLLRPPAPQIARHTLFLINMNIIEIE